MPLDPKKMKMDRINFLNLKTKHRISSLDAAVSGKTLHGILKSFLIFFGQNVGRI